MHGTCAYTGRCFRGPPLRRLSIPVGSSTLAESGLTQVVVKGGWGGVGWVGQRGMGWGWGVVTHTRRQKTDSRRVIALTNEQRTLFQNSLRQLSSLHVYIIYFLLPFSLFSLFPPLPSFVNLMFSSFSAAAPRAMSCVPTGWRPRAYDRVRYVNPRRTPDNRWPLPAELNQCLLLTSAVFTLDETRLKSITPDWQMCGKILAGGKFHPGV